MDWIETIKQVLAIAETAALLGALILGTMATKTEKGSPDKRKYFQRSGIFIFVFLVLKVLRLYFYGE